MHKFHVNCNLHEDVILRINFSLAHQLIYCPKHKRFYWGISPQWLSGSVKICKETKLEPWSVAFVKANLVTLGGCLPGPNTKCLVHIFRQNQPHLTGGPS